MKTKRLFILAALAGIFQGRAADLCVAEAGGGGCYSSITAAINAASNGDRIIIYPSNAPFAENLSVTKSLQFLCATEGAQWKLQGNIIITPAPGRTVTIISMKNYNGYITATGSNSAGLRCNVNIFGSTLDNGYIAFDYDNFNLNVAADTLSDGYVSLRFGRVIGSTISTAADYNYIGSGFTSSLYINTDVTATNDSVFVVGNKFDVNVVPYSYKSAIYTSSTSQFYYMVNNYITGTSVNYPIYITASKSSTQGHNTISNTTINTPTLSVNAISLYAATPSYFDIQNNILLGQSGYGFYYASGGPVAFSYNYMNNPLTIYNFSNDGTNNVSSNTTLNASGKPNAGSDAINGGNPDSSYYDINLTRCDAGAYGGSFTLDNFFPISGASRVYFMVAPRRITIGNTLSVEADAFDR